MKDIIAWIGGFLGSFIVMAFGGWSEGLTTLFIFMVIDYLTGLICAGVFKKSKKTDTGALSSKVGWEGIARKVFTVLFIMVAYRADLLLGTNFLMNMFVIAFIIQEVMSITENAGLMGVPLPEAVKKMLDLLNAKEKELID